MRMNGKRFRFDFAYAAKLLLNYFKHHTHCDKSSWLLTILLFGTAGASLAQTTRYWQGGTGTWGTAANWKDGLGNPGVPTSVDIVVFNSGNVNCALPAVPFPPTIVVAGLTITSGYTGTISLNGKALQVNATQAIDINTAPPTTIAGGGFGTVIINAGTFDVTIKGVTTSGGANVTVNSASGALAGVGVVTIASNMFNAGLTINAPDDIAISGNTFKNFVTINNTLTSSSASYSLSGIGTSNTFVSPANVTIQNSGVGTFNYSSDAYNVPLTVSNTAAGTLTVDDIIANGAFTVKPNAGGILNACQTGDCQIGGNLTVQSNSGSVGVFTFGNSVSSATSAAVQFIGNSAQTMNIGVGVTSLAFTKLILNKSAVATITANTAVQITYTATMTNGIFTMGTNTITFKDPASVTGYSTSSFVDGLVQYGSASGTVTFPTGSATGLIYRPVTIIFSGAEPTLSNISAQYFNSAAPASTSLNGLTNVSLFEYWKVNASPSQDFNAVLSWKNADTNNPNYVVNETNLRVSRFSALQWQNNGGTATASGSFSFPPAAGIITSSTINSGGGNIGNLTLGSTNTANELHKTWYRWRNTTGNNLWNTAANWDSNAVPTATDVAVFDGGGASGNTPCILPIASVTVGGLLSMPPYSSSINLNSVSLNVNAVTPTVLNGGNLVGTGNLVITGTNPVDISGITAATTATVTVSGNPITIGSSTFSGSLSLSSTSIVKLTGNTTAGQLTFPASLDLNGRSLTVNGNNVTTNLTGVSITNSGSANSVFITSSGTGGINITGTTFGTNANLNANNGSTTTSTITGGAIFNGSVDFTAPAFDVANAVFNGTTTLTKTNNVTDSWSGGATFNADATLNFNSGAGITNPSANRATFNGKATFKDNLTTLFPPSVSNVKLAGDLTIVSNTSSVGLGTIEFIGGATQTIDVLGAGPNAIVSFSDIILNKTGAANVVNSTNVSDIYINTSMTFTNGILKLSGTSSTSGSGKVLFFGGTATGMNNSSYVDGYVERFGSSTGFTYPVGAGGFYRPFMMSGGTDISIKYFQGTGVTPDISGLSGLVNVSTCEYWATDVWGYGLGVTITIPWTYSYCGNSTYIGDLPNLKVANHELGLPQWDFQGGTVAVTTPGVGGTITSSGFDVGGVRLFTLGSTSPTFTNPLSNVVLPIKLAEISANLAPDGVHIKWETASEINNDHFEIERSLNGKDFAKIGEVDGHGTTTVPHEYSWLDQRPPGGLLYYRLRQVDFDEVSTYSKVISVSNFADQDQEEFSIYPVPVRDKLFLSGKYDVRIMDVLGKVVFTGQEVDEINVEALEPGFYFILRLQTSETRRFAKN